MTDCGQIYTHYYKLAHVGAISYGVYGAKEHVLDQLLLELELQIRHQHPKILLAYYNKSLYHFSFSHWENTELLDAYPVELRSQAAASVEMLANPSRAQKRSEPKPPEDLAYASLSFLKAVKKALLYTLLAEQKMQLFGNYVVGKVAPQQYAIVQVDPVLLATGDLIVSLTQKCLPLFPSSVLSADVPVASFVIYVVPSGLRCHLYDTRNVALSFTKTPPKSAQNLLRLLKLSTGVDRAEQDVLWVKLIPNLQHLNNQTSKILHFVHDVDNKKYIVWPWELCLLQFGSVEEQMPDFEGPENADPLSLINDFLAFSVNLHEEAQPIHTESASISAATTIPEVFDRAESVQEKEEEKETEKEEENADEDLFGDSSELEKEAEAEEEAVEEEDEKEEEKMQEDEKEREEKKEELENTVEEIKEIKTEKRVPKSDYVSIPKNEMILKIATPGSYSDPGAPPPIMPTPVVPQKGLKEENTYAFSPIVFNPKIQNSIDTKYGKGGKFYVEREDSAGPENEKKLRMRETSVYKDERKEREDERDPEVEMEREGSEIEMEREEDDMEENDLEFSEKSDDESDEDEDDHFLDLKMSPLKLNTHSGDILHNMSQNSDAKLSVPSTSYPAFGNSNFDSPSISHMRSEWRGDSPMASGSHLVDHGSFSSSPGEIEKEKTELKSEETSPLEEGVSESSNCLPLILRSINVFSIPSVFLLRENAISSDFNMDLDEDDDISDGLKVKKKEIDQFLRWLMASLVFDMGQSKFRSLRLKVPLAVGGVVESATDGVSRSAAECFYSAFPLCYRVTLNELMEEPEEDVKELSFLDEITSDGSGRKSAMFWDSLRPDSDHNKENFSRYTEEKPAQNVPVDDNIFQLNEVRSKIVKSANLVNFNFVGLRFWRYLNFRPVNGTKKFQVLMISENDNFVDYGNLYDNSNLGFLEMLKYNYKENHLGTIDKLHLPSETRPDESVSHGLLLVEKSDFYAKVNRKLRNLAEMIKLDLMTKSNRFEFDRPLLLLFLNFDESLLLISQIAKICRNFHVFLKDRQLPLVQVFSHILPGHFVSRKAQNKCYPRHISELKLSKLALTLYNKCPDIHENSKTDTRRLYTQLVKPTPTSINFKFLNKEHGSAFQDDLFLHVAYERSVDKNWISAAWSDPLGIVTHVRLWWCSGDVGAIIMEIWDISNDLFVRLKDDLLQRTCGSDKKRFLVLTRISSIIPDDELIFWKRLTAKYKEVSLIVLSTSRLPKYLFSLERGTLQSEANESSFKSDFQSIKSDLNSFKSDLNFQQSPSNGLSFNLPNQFSNANFFSPEGPPEDADVVVKDPRYDIIGVVPKMPLPSFNSPTRLGMRIGYLIKESQSDEADVQYMVFEVTLLSCLAYWSLNLVMKILLNQYKNMIVLNEIMGVCLETEEELRRLVPWHINAVVKTLDYLVHVQVEE